MTKRPRRSKDGYIGRKRARTAREDVGLDPLAPIPCLVEVIEERFAIPVTLTVMPEPLEGACTTLGETTALWVHAREFAPRSRFTLAHELGHVRCGHGRNVLDTADDINRPRNAEERQANAFAAEFLAPDEAVIAFLEDRPADIAEVVAVAAHFGLSTVAALYRCSTVGLVADQAALKARIDAEEHREAWEAHDAPEWDDLLARAPAQGLPRVSPLLAGTAVGALVAGDTSVEAAASFSSAVEQDLRDVLAIVGL